MWMKRGVWEFAGSRDDEISLIASEDLMPFVPIEADLGTKNGAGQQKEGTYQSHAMDASM